MTGQGPGPSSGGRWRLSGAPGSVVELRGLSAAHDGRLVLHRVSLQCEANAVTALIGPADCGKSSLLRCINRLHEQAPGSWVEGRVLLDGVDVYAPNVDLTALRRRVGLVTAGEVFGSMSILEAVSAGMRFAALDADAMAEAAERALRRVGLWEDLLHELDAPAAALDARDRLRLALARALTLEPTVLLVDAPCTGLDRVDTLRIEELLADLARDATIVLASSSIDEARRIADRTAVLLEGELIEIGDTHHVFSGPSDPRTEAYITGAAR